jgi:hypothetical protein
MYDYSVYKQTSGKTFVDNLVTRSTYHVVDPDKNSSSSFYYSHKTSVPVLYGAAVVSYENGVGVYSVQLRGSGGMVNSFSLTPSETRVGKDLYVPNDIYVGTAGEWRLHVDVAGGRFLFQKKGGSGQYSTAFEIVQQN